MSIDLSHHGDEVIVTNDKDKVKLLIKIQTGRNEHRMVKLSFETQTQCERLLPSIMKALK